MQGQCAKAYLNIFKNNNVNWGLWDFLDILYKTKHTFR